MHQLLVGKDETARAAIAGRVGEYLSCGQLPDAELKAAEALARHLVADSIERVRVALSEAVRTARHLPRDVALRIAHDVDAVACPFLQATEVFSDKDWQQLVLTISRGARIATARRTSMSEGLAKALAEVGDSVVAQCLVENPSAPMTPPVCEALIDRFGETVWVLDKLAERDDIYAETAARLVSRVSDVLRQKLTERYKLNNQAAEEVAVKTETGAVLSLISQLPKARLPSFVQFLSDRRRLSFGLMLEALRAGEVDFFSVAMADFAGLPIDKTDSIIERGHDGSVTALLSKAGVPHDIYAEIWEALRQYRSTRREAAG